MKFDVVTIPATGTIPVASGYLGVTDAQLTAHPSNSGVIYVKRSGDTGIGYPLAAGGKLDITGSDNLYNYVASGAPAARLAYGYNQ